MKRILGISAFYHDSAAALIIDEKIIAAAQEERFTRKKHTSDFPVHAIRYCLKEGGLDIDELDAIVFYDKPFLKFERLLQTYYAFAPKGLFSFLKAIPIWLREKMFLKKLIYDGLKEVGRFNRKKSTLLFSEHHLSHAASAFFVSNYASAAILTVDGVGEWCTASIGIGKNSSIEILKEMEFPHSVGLLYSAFTYYLGFKVNSGEYKLMGLAPYGNPNSIEVQAYIDLIKNNLVDIKADGSIWLNQSYFSYATGLRMTKNRKWEQLFGFPKRQAESEILQHHCNLALAIQSITEEIVLRMAHEAKRVTNADYLCMAGGVALNCVANEKLVATGLFKDIFFQPASGDAGGALGAAFAVLYLYFKKNRTAISELDSMQGSYLGPDFSEKEIILMNRKTKAITTKIKNSEKLSEVVSAKIEKGNIIGWFQGRMEYGPRALGNRSILADPTNIEMQRKLNLNIKYRESFRPFAPSVVIEDATTYFKLEQKSPYMLLTAPIQNKFKKNLPKNYYELPLLERLAIERSTFPAITHIDFSARVQTVSKNVNFKYWQLLNTFKKRTGHSMLINTSFNVRGEPIVCTPLDAYRCFMCTEMDYLVIGNFIYTKKEQPIWDNKENWKENHTLD